MMPPPANVIDFPAPRRRRGTWRGMKLAENITHFVRTLRRAGMDVGPAAVLDCVEASREIDLGNRDEFYHALASCLVKRPEDRLLFDQAFHIFWRNPRLMEKMRDLLLPTLARDGEAEETPPTARRVDEALRAEAPPPITDIEDSERVEIDKAEAGHFAGDGTACWVSFSRQRQRHVPRPPRGGRARCARRR